MVRYADAITHPTFYYSRIDRQVMWDITESDLPPLKSFAERLPWRIVEQMLQDFKDN